MRDVYLGIDIGTSGTKSLAIDDLGNILASATATYDLLQPKPGWSEQVPADWWQATIATVRELVKVAALQPGEVKGIGLSGQMHGSVFLDERNEVIRPALLWNDQRTKQECTEIEQRAGSRGELLRMVSNPALTGFTAPKILWLRNHEPRHFDATRKVLLPKDYIRYRLTGEFATEVSDASGTLLLDVAHRCWSKELLGRLQLDENLLPACHESEEVSGTLSAVAAEQLGLPSGIPVVGGGGDQAAGAVGNGIVARGVISATLGTSGVVFAHSDEVKTDPGGRLHTFCHAVRGKWHQMGVMLSAGGSLQWYRNELGGQEVQFASALRVDPYELLTLEASKATPGSEGLWFLPYLTGERTPHANPDARGAWIGLTSRHGRPHLIRALMEGVTYGMRDSLELIKGLGVPIEEIRVSGGGARGTFWRQLQADIYGQEVVTINAHEGPAFGVALLAAVGTGRFPDVPTACKATIRPVSVTKPQPDNQRRYDRYYKLFGAFYRALESFFPEMGQE